MIRSKRVKCYDLTGTERNLRPGEFERLKKKGVVKEKPSKKEEKKETKTKEEKTSNTTK